MDLGLDPELTEELAALEARARRVSAALGQRRRPFVIEFAGTPKSGKTSTLVALEQFFKRNGVQVRVYQERASVSPLKSKGTPGFNSWVTCATLMGLLEAIEDEKLDIFVLDRGLFDGLVWCGWQEKTLQLSGREAGAFREFFLTPRWRNLIDLVLVMHCDPKTAIEREYANQITLKPGSVMREEVLTQLREHVLMTANTHRGKFRRVEIVDTSNGEARRGIMRVAEKALGVLEEFLDEDVLCIPRTDFSGLLGQETTALKVPDSWDVVRRVIDEHGSYQPRSVAEASDDWVQIVPVCVIEHDGRFLTNLRFEPGETLDDTLANWAGGHVRKEDLCGQDSKWESVITGLRREIDEELKIAHLPEPLTELGLVHTAETERAARHLGVAFLVHLEDAATAQTLDGRTLRERPTKHVKTSWVSPDDLLTTPKQKDWSLAIGHFLSSQRK